MKIEKCDQEKKDRAYISPSMRQLIIAESLNVPRIPRTALARNLINIFKNQYGKDAPLPAIETLEKLISKARNYDNKAWHLGLLRQYCRDISPDAIPYILAVQSWLDKQNWTINLQKLSGEGRHLSVKEAQWIARLFRTIKSLDDDEIGHLYRISHWYAIHEIMHDISNKDEDEFDTSEIDRALRNDKMQELYESDIIAAIEGKNPLLDAYRKLRDTKKGYGQKIINREITRMYIDRLVENGTITIDEAETIKRDTKALDIIIQKMLSEAGE
ncbi:MAG: hypothetical protein PHU23_12840 [Dehalococcoidales bacterium]|nr:hypothetical protein [Dehalococcoidales bacterium]